MQDRYAGDIGDYGKIGLLRAIQRNHLRIGVNWYKTEPTQGEYQKDGSLKQKDGKYQIPSKLAVCDPELADALLDISKRKTRSIRDIQTADLIPNAVYHDEDISVADREGWHSRALSKTACADVVFLDPDNGLKVDSVSKGSWKSVKYAFYEEVKDYVCRGQSVVVYNHRSRKLPAIYFGEIYERLRNKVEIGDEMIQPITFPRYSVRDYFIICASNDHYLKIQEALDQLVQGIWGEKGMCHLPSL